jgi:hypothetical protein
MSTVYWTMKNGEKIDVDKMEIDHLRNALKMIIRNHENPPMFKRGTKFIDYLESFDKSDKNDNHDEDIFVIW